MNPEDSRRSALKVYHKRVKFDRQQAEEALQKWKNKHRGELKAAGVQPWNHYGVISSEENAVRQRLGLAEKTWL